MITDGIIIPKMEAIMIGSGRNHLISQIPPLTRHEKEVSFF